MDKKIKILLVEDEFIIAMSLERELVRSGYMVVKTVSSGEKAIEAVRQKETDVILMDIQLAGQIDGIEAAAEIRSFSQVPIIFMTGYSNPEILNRLKELSPLGYLTKPVLIFDLKKIIDTL